MEKEITLKQLSELLDFGERAERVIDHLFFTPPPPTKKSHSAPPRRLILRSSRLGHKLAKN